MTKHRCSKTEVKSGIRGNVPYVERKCLKCNKVVRTYKVKEV